MLVDKRVKIGWYEEAAIQAAARLLRSAIGDHIADAGKKVDEAKHHEQIAQKYEDRYFGLVRMCHALLDRDITYDGCNVVLPFESHDQAMNHIAEARRKVGNP